MKTKSVVLVFLLINLINPVFARETKDPATQATEALTAGIKLAKSTKFEQAQAQFENGLKYWQYYNFSGLCIQIIKDYDQQVIKNKYIKEIFNAVYEDFIAGKPQNALKKIDNVIKKNDTCLPAYILKANFLLSLEMKEKAEEAYAKAVAIAPNAAPVYVFRGKFYAGQGLHDKAVADFSRAIEIEPGSASYRFERGFVYCLQHRYDEAIRDFEIAIKQYPAWEQSTIVLEAFHNRGVLRIQNENYREAILDFNRTIKIDPEYSNSYLNRGIAYRNLNQYSNAIKDFNVCIQKNPDVSQAYYQRGLAYLDKQDYNKATADLEKVNTMTPNDTQVLAKLADVCNKSGNYQKALSYLNKILTIDDKYFWAYYHQGFAYACLKKAKEAIQAFKTFVALAPKQYYKQIATAEAEIKKLRSGL